jgi:hypothetical protein
MQTGCNRSRQQHCFELKGDLVDCAEGDGGGDDMSSILESMAAIEMA